MINSLMSRMADAEKLSIPQLQKSIQDGVIPAYVGVPLLQDKLQQQKTKTAPQQPAQPPIAQQVLAEAAQHGIDSAPSNLPTQMAGGGIVAFDGGGLADDQTEDEEYGGMNEQDTALLEKYMASITADSGSELDEEMPEGVVSMHHRKGETENRGVGLKHDKKGASEGIQYTDKKHKYEKEIREAARKAGISEDLFLHMMAKETGGLDNPESAKSKAGAMGIAQFMPATAKQYGIDPMDMNQALPAAAKMTSSLLKHYGGDQRLAAMAYNWGQGNVDKWLATGADPSKVPGETRGYTRAAEGGIMRLAEGGEVKRFGLQDSKEQLVEEEPESALGAFFKKGIIPEFGTKSDADKKFAADYIKGLKLKEQQQKALTAPDMDLPFYKAVKPSERQLVEDKRKAILNGNIPTAPTTPTTPQFNVQPSSLEMGPTREELGAGPADMRSEEEKDQANIDAKIKEATGQGRGDEDIASLREMLTERAKSAKNQKSIDNYMALLQAGLGMMGGTSPYAMANIGQGASKGISALADARRSQIAEENALLTGRLGLSRAQLLETSRKNALARQYALDRQNYGLKTQQLDINRNKLGQAERGLLLKAEDLYEKKGGDALLKQEFAKQYGKNWETDPMKLKLFKAKRQEQVGALFNMAQTDSDIPSASTL
jgi:Transglycosylase SLT domain